LLTLYGAPPAAFSVTVNDSQDLSCVCSWPLPDERLQGAWNNQTDTIEGAASGIALAAVELYCGLYAIARVETRGGADYYIGPRARDLGPHVSLREQIRLEVSGTTQQGEAPLTERFRQKREQPKRASKATPSMAAVVGFPHWRILVGGPE